MKTVKDKLYHFEETPPSEVWEKLAGKINGGKIVNIRTRTRTKRAALITAAAAVIVLLLVNFIFLQRPGHSDTDAPATALSQPDSIDKNNELLEQIINAPENKKMIASNHMLAEGFKKYFTIEGPEGEPVKISPKVATLIVSADSEYPPKPVWDKKISEWQHIMLTNNIAPTSANLIEIIQQAANN